MKLIDQVLEETGGICEYALYTKALIKRQKGAQWQPRVPTDLAQRRA